jgi:hypothetical protein
MSRGYQKYSPEFREETAELVLRALVYRGRRSLDSRAAVPGLS